MADYIALEDGFHITLEDASGALLLELQGVVLAVPSVPSPAAFGVPAASTSKLVVGSVPSAAQFGSVGWTTRITAGVPGVPSAAAFGAVRPSNIVQVQGIDPYTLGVPSITGQVISGDGHVVGGSGSGYEHFGRVTIIPGRTTIPVPSVQSAAQFGSTTVGLVVFNVWVRPIVCTDTSLVGITCDDTVLVASAPTSVTLQPAGVN